MWYVIQTMTGREERLKKEIENMVPGELYERVVVPYSEGKRRYEGAWHTERTILFPGYVFFVTEDIVAAIPSVRKVYQRVKLLGDGEEIYPLYKEEEEILSRLCGSGEDAWDDDLIGMSVKSETGEDIGTVKDVLSRSVQDLYEIEMPSGKTFLLPAVKEFIKDVDISEKAMTVKLPEGISQL